MTYILLCLPYFKSEVSNILLISKSSNEPADFANAAMLCGPADFANAAMPCEPETCFHIFFLKKRILAVNIEEGQLE